MNAMEREKYEVPYLEKKDLNCGRVYTSLFGRCRAITGTRGMAKYFRGEIMTEIKEKNDACSIAGKSV